MKKGITKIICILMAFLLAAPVNLMQVRAKIVVEDVFSKLIPETTDNTKENYFKYTAYAGKSWTNNGNEAYIDLGASDEKAEECFYEIYFTGKAISVYATKRNTHGKVKFTVDGKEEQIVDLYSQSTIDAAKVYTADNLENGQHVLKAVTLNEKTGSKIVNQVKYAEITGEISYDSDEIGSFGGSIVDTDLQYTKERYNEVVAKQEFSKNLTAWKNDKAVSELVLYAKDGKVEDVTVTAGPLKCGDNIIGTENITTTFIKSTKAYNGPYIDGYGSPTRPLPEVTPGNRSESSDILDQSGGSVDIPRNSLQPVWVEYSIPKDAKAGIYQGVILATAKDIDEPLVFTYTVEVQDETLPEEETFGETFDIELWQYPYSSAEYYGVEPFSDAHLEILKPIMLKYKEIGGHAITTTISEDAWNGQTYSANDIHYPSMVTWTKETDGSFSYDYSDFDRWVAFCKELGVGDKIVLYSIAPWHNSFTYWENGEMKKEGFTAGSERYNAVWGDFLEDLVGHLEEKGWFDDAYIGIDEQGFSAAAFDIVDSVTNQDGESLKTAGAMDGFINKKDLAMRVDDLNVGDNAAAAHPSEFAAVLEERKEAGLRTTLYSCTEHKPGNFSLSAPVESYWSIINAAKMKTAGFLRWAYDAWVEDPLNDTTHNAFEPGDCFLVFPDEKDAEDPQCKSSVRLERMAEGVRDVNKLMLIEQKAPALSSEIENLYERIQTTAGTSRSYMSDADKERLAQEMNAFKEGVAKITDKYLDSITPGLHVTEREMTILKGEKGQISHFFIPESENEKIIYESENPSIATVDGKGSVTARGAGETVITLLHRKTGSQASVKITVPKQTAKPVEELCISNALTDYKLPDTYLSDVAKGPQTGERHYLGQPDMIMLNDNKTLITVYPTGHGIGSVEMKISRDAGESWEEKPDIPESWSQSRETPTLYKLNFRNGDTKLILISGRPSWGDSNAIGGWDTSISTDNGETWSEYKRFHETLPNGGQNYSVVAMASLIQLCDDEGKPMDKWMGVYHDLNYVNYKTYLTFDENGQEQWTAPAPYLNEYREIETSHLICEVGLFRSPDGERIVGLARNQTHNGPATMFYSDDEGETWSKPVPLPGSLAGERHKILYDPTDPTGQRIVIPFREIKYDLNGNNRYDGYDDWIAGDWVAWVGTYDDLMNQRDGSFRILLCEDWAANAKSGDTGYTGFVVQPDGTFIMDTYGHWDREYSESLPNYNVYNDWCWIKQAKFKISDVAEDFGFANEAKTSITEELGDLPEISDASDYTNLTWSGYKAALEEMKKTLENENATWDDINAAYVTLQTAYQNLVMKGAGNNEDLVPEMRKSLDAAIESAAVLIGKGSQNYTPASWTIFENAYRAAKAAGNLQVYEELKQLYDTLIKAQNGLTILSKEVKAFEADGNSYQVTDASAGTVKLMKGSDAKTVKIDTVSYGGKTYRVVAIASNAFYKFKKLQNVTIGANVASIEKNAFNNCKKLKKVTFKGQKLPSMKKAFKKTAKKLTVKVPKSLKKNAKVKKKTQKTLKNAGLKVTTGNIK